MAFDREKFLEDLESFGISEVKRKIKLRVWDKDKIELAKEWLSEKEDQLSSEASVRAEAREEDMLASTKEANSIARDANDIAVFAIRETRRLNRIDRIIAIVAIIIAIIAAREDIIWLIKKILSLVFDVK